MEKDDPASVSAERIRVGERMRLARVASGMSVRELARRMDVSASHVSNVERGLASFSVQALYKLVGILGISMDSLFAESDATGSPGDVPPDLPADLPDEVIAAVPEEILTDSGHGAAQGEDVADTVRSAFGGLDESGMVLRESERPTIPLPGGVRWERLTPYPLLGSEFIEVIYPPSPGGEPPEDFIRHGGVEFGVIVHGTLTIQVGFNQTDLRTGDSIAFDSGVPHRYWNKTSDEVRAIWFVGYEPKDVTKR